MLVQNDKIKNLSTYNLGILFIEERFNPKYHTVYFKWTCPFFNQDKTIHHFRENFKVKTGRIASSADHVQTAGM
jgi:hypothetical protein